MPLNRRTAGVSSVTMLSPLEARSALWTTTSMGASRSEHALCTSHARKVKRIVEQHVARASSPAVRILVTRSMQID